MSRQKMVLLAKTHTLLQWSTATVNGARGRSYSRLRVKQVINCWCGADCSKMKWKW
ncbi:unnamed protein product [Brugia timori]|uniref:Uncharacterized protein n=1 Tax=Brugia timori TaxID=42155 RepID=A0A0R3QMF8_9BILA|nr:unnamed protein product [Brugia timori]